MKNPGKILPGITVCLGLGLMFGSCKKDSNSPNPNQPDSTAQVYYVSSQVSAYGTETIVDSFLFDGTKRMATWLQSAHDPTNPTEPSDNHKTTISFVYSGNDSLPSSYVYKDSGTAQTYTHNLSYDTKGRIIKDSMLYTYSQVFTFSYGTNIIAINTNYYPDPSNNMQDSLFLSNGNVASWRQYEFDANSSTWSVDQIVNFTYSKDANPLYNPKIAPGMGPLLWVIAAEAYTTFLDPLSVNAMSGISAPVNGGAYASSITAKKDDKGRVISLTSSVPIWPSLSFNYYQ